MKRVAEVNPGPVRALLRSRLVLGSVVALGLALGCNSADESVSTEGHASPRSSATADARATPPARPNLLLITMDTTRADALGAYGQRRSTSPVFDRLAQSGVLFERVSTASPETLPAHATILTGLWPYVHGARANAGYVLPARNRTLAEHLRGLGYRTGVEIAAPVLRKETGITQGFDSYHDTETAGVKLKRVQYKDGLSKSFTAEIRVASDITSRGIAFVREHRERSFFLWLHYFDAHNPDAAPASFARKISDSGYHAEVAYQDFQIGLVVDELERLGLAKSTLVAVTADHGEGLGEHGEPSHSYFVYDSTMRVPLVLWGLERLPQNRIVPSPVRTVDVAPTLLDLLGVAPLPETDGVSLVPLMDGRRSDLSLTAYGEATRFYSTFGTRPLRFVREGRWKYIHKVNPELYDLELDPGEETNVASREPEVVRRLLDRLKAMLRAAPAKSADAEARIDQQMADQLIALGYVARSPSRALEDEVGSLELSGRDPLEHRDDARRLALVPALMKKELYEDALAEVRPVVDRNPDNPHVLTVTAQILTALERYGEARPLLERALVSGAEDSEAARSLAALLRETGEEEEAVRVLQGLAERDACDREVQLELIGSLHAQGRYKEELDVARAGAERCPELLLNRNNYAWALATLPPDDLRDGSKAVEIMRGAIGELEGPDASYLDTLAAALAESGRFEDAAQTQSEAIRLLERSGAEPDLVDDLRSRLIDYRAGRPTRDPPANAP